MYINEITATTITTNTAATNQDSQIINIEKHRKSPSTSSDSGVNCNNEEDTSSMNYLFNGVNNNNQNDNDNKRNDNEIELKNINFSTANTITENFTHKNNDVNSKENDNQIMMNVISKNLNNSNRNNRSHKSSTSSSSSSSNSSICSSNNSNNNNNNFNYNLNNNNYNNVQQNDNNNNNSEIISPTTSVNSNRISIVSIDDDDIESSVIDSDDDDDFDDLNDPDIIPIGNNRNYIIKKLSERIDKNDDGGIIVINQNNDNNILSTLPEVRDDGGICIPNDSENIIKNVTANNSGKPQIGSIAVQNSTDITFGNKTFYQGPVTIKQFVLEKKTEDTKICVNNKVTVNGKDNFGFDCDAELGGETNQRNNNRYNLNTTRGYLSQKLNLNRKTSTILGAAILFILLICAVVFTLQAILHNSSNTNSGDGDDSRKHIPINSTIDNDNISDGRVLRMVTRDEWVAQPAMGELRPLNLPTHRVIIAHTATEGCNTQASCVFRVRFIQTFHIESRNFDDIAYNFLVGGDGSVYEGRGWDKEGAHTKGYNVDSICVAFIGTFIQIEPNEKQLKAAKMIIEEGVRLGKIVPDYKLYGHRQLMASESPGEALYKIIQKWSHWSNELD